MGIQFKQFVSETLAEILQPAKEQNEQVYFIIDANVRKHWIKELQNEKIDIDTFPDIVPDVLKVPNLNAVRINTSFDVPKYGVIECDDVLDSTSLYMIKRECIIALVSICVMIVKHCIDIYLKYYL